MAITDRHHRPSYREDIATNQLVVSVPFGAGGMELERQKAAAAGGGLTSVHVFKFSAITSGAVMPAVLVPVTDTARATVDIEFGHTIYTNTNTSSTKHASIFTDTPAQTEALLDRGCSGDQNQFGSTSMETDGPHWHKQVFHFIRTDDGQGLSHWLQTHLTQQQQQQHDVTSTPSPQVDQLHPESGLSILHVAAAKGKVSCCEALLKFGVQVKKPSRKGCQAIHLACRHGQVEVIKLLLERAADDRQQKTPQWASSSSSSSSSSSAAAAGVSSLSLSLSLLSEVTDDGWYPLHEAVWNNKQNVIQFLLTLYDYNDDNDVININVKTRVKLETALMLAVRSVNEVVCEEILSNEKTCLEERNSSGLTAVLIACAIGHESILHLLVSRGASVTATTHKGATGAHLASRYGHVHILQKLNQIQPELFESRTVDGWSCLHEASDTDNSQVANYLLLHTSVDVNAQTSPGGNTALHIAAKKAHASTFCTICDTFCIAPDTLNVGLKNRNKETVWNILDAQSPPDAQPDQIASMKQSLDNVGQRPVALRNQISTPATVASASESRNEDRAVSSSRQTSFSSISISAQPPRQQRAGGTASLDDVFLSYCWAQSVLVEKIHARMSRKKFKVWLDKFRINPGDRLYDKLQEGVSNCKVFVPCLSAQYLNSDNCRSEFHLAKLWKKPIVPLILDPSLTKRWPPGGELAPLLAPLVYLQVLKDKQPGNNSKNNNSSTSYELDLKQIDKLCEKVSSLETDHKLN